MVTSGSRSPGLNRSFHVAIALILLFSAALGASLILSFWRNYERGRDGVTHILAFSTALTVASQLSAERGPANAALGRATTGAEARAGRLAEFRQRADASLSAQPASPARAALEAQLARARRAVDALLDKPLAERNPDAVRAAIEAMFAAADRAGPVIDASMARTIIPGSNLLGRSVTARMLGEMREQAGRMGSAIVIAIAYGRPMDAEQSVAFGQAKGAVLQLWHLVQQQLRVSDSPAVAQAQRDVESDFMIHGLRVIADAQMRLQEGDKTLTSPVFTRSVVPTFASIERLRDAYLHQVIKALKVQRDEALQALIVAGLAVALTLSAEVLLLFVGQQLLFRPLLTARDEVMRLADGQLDQAVPQSPVRGEMRGLFDALAALRDRLIERNRLDAERSRLEERLRHQAETDGLTGALNRGALERAAARLATMPGPIGLILLDLDHFKGVNDRFGHTAGDAVLRAMAQRLGAALAGSDLLARFGGEEFAILVTGPRAEALTALAMRLRQIIESEPFALPDQRFVAVTASLGTAVSMARPGMWKALLEAADAALYQAKNNGRNRVVAGM